MTHKGKTVHLSEAYEGNQSNKNPILRQCKKEEHCYHKSNLKILFRKYNLFKKNLCSRSIPADSVLLYIDGRLK